MSLDFKILSTAKDPLRRDRQTDRDREEEREKTEKIASSL